MEFAWNNSFGWADIIQIAILAFAVYAAFSANKNVAKSVVFSENRKLLDAFIEKISVLCNAGLYSSETQDKTRAEFAGVIDRILAYTSDEKITNDVEILFETVKKKQALFNGKETEQEIRDIFESSECKALDLELSKQKKLLYKELKEGLNNKEKKIKKARSLTRLSKEEQKIINLYRAAGILTRAKTLQVLSQKRQNQEQARRYSIGSGHLKKQDCSKENPVEQKEF